MAVRIWKTARTSLAVGTAIYAAGDALGAQQSFKVPDSGIIRAVVLTDADDEASVDVKVWFFDSQPTVIAANAAFDLADADAELVQGVIALTAAAAEHDSISNRVKYATASVPYRTDGGLLWVQCEVEAGTPTYSLTTDVKLQLIVEW